ncbi:hypothetical protein T484DRAFT_3626296 [Baffinella frigidus]|nr:hypothetical protein T484DRAFT_3626296 [Cryptophyta sp. CCMP2293]
MRGAGVLRAQHMHLHEDKRMSVSEPPQKKQKAGVKSLTPPKKKRRGEVSDPPPKKNTRRGEERVGGPCREARHSRFTRARGLDGRQRLQGNQWLQRRDGRDVRGCRGGAWVRGVACGGGGGGGRAAAERRRHVVRQVCEARDQDSRGARGRAFRRGRSQGGPGGCAWVGGRRRCFGRCPDA